MPWLYQGKNVPSLGIATLEVLSGLSEAEPLLAEKELPPISPLHRRQSTAGS